jgi:1-phosphatidylinositol-3-phosphate 5-kinase
MDRTELKTIFSARNRQVLIELAPSYFLHMESTASRASILAKLLGFYTVEVRNLENGTVLAKADLLVMENLFNGQKPTKTFDLKGIQGRKVKAKSNSSASKTLFDSEWIEGESLILICPLTSLSLLMTMFFDCRSTARAHIGQPRFKNDFSGSFEGGL